ncbi:MAG TPA: ScyD/ScyE family protein, partial [Blastocatellia bacterium]|nr:ScyD/ScyE family protein [Blastocatellia bacterium]
HSTAACYREDTATRLAEGAPGFYEYRPLTNSTENFRRHYRFFLLVSETGTPVPNTGRISIVDVDGNRRTLLDGLPSGINDVNEPSGPAGLFMRGRSLYVAIGIGDAVLAGPLPGTNLPNPNPSSPIFNSILAIHLSANLERTTAGFTLTLADQQSLASGEHVTLSNGVGDAIMVELVSNLPGYTPNPLPFLANNVRGVNPFDLVLVGHQVYVTDGAQNSLWQVDIPTGAFSILATFPDITNPFFPGLGGPFIEPVPTGVRYSDGQLLVTLFKGFPFLPGTSEVCAVDPKTGSQTSFVPELTAAIDVAALREGSDTDRFRPISADDCHKIVTSLWGEPEPTLADFIARKLSDQE